MAHDIGFLPCRFGATGRAPSDPKALKSYGQATEALKQHRYFEALDKFKKANKQDGGQCSSCLEQIALLASALGNFKDADSASRDLIELASTPTQKATHHCQRGLLLLQEGTAKKKPALLTEADEQFKAALAIDPKDTKSLYAEAVPLARLQQDETAKAKFSRVAELSPPGLMRSRALRFAARPELAREPMAPPFEVSTDSGQRISLDELAGMVVLIDFWGTWCALAVKPCPV